MHVMMAWRGGRIHLLLLRVHVASACALFLVLCTVVVGTADLSVGIINGGSHHRCVSELLIGPFIGSPLMHWRRADLQMKMRNGLEVARRKERGHQPRWTDHPLAPVFDNCPLTHHVGTNQYTDNQH